MINGQSRTSARVTFAFFAHNGFWPSPPAFASVFGGAPFTPAPADNNLD
jgi:hypothetical protein